MEEKIFLTKKLNLVNMNEVDISTEDKPIIGTQALATCVGILLYNEKDKWAIVAHASDVYWEDIVAQTIDLVSKNYFGDSLIKYKVIPGYYYNHYDIAKKIENFYRAHSSVFIPFDELDNNVHIDDNTTSCEFAFDSRSGKFVTDKVLFGKDYLDINSCKEYK